MLKYQKNLVTIFIDNFVKSNDTSIHTYAIQPYEHTNGSKIDLLSKTIIRKIRSVHYTKKKREFLILDPSQKRDV